MNSITLFLFFIPALALILLGINLVFAPHNPYQEKSSTFECGFHSFLGQNRMQFSISFFIFALLFLVFDLELVMTLPAFISMSVITYYGLFFVIIFFTVLTLGFAFEIGKKALKIDSKQYDNTLPSSIGIVYTILVYIAVQIFKIEEKSPLFLSYKKEKFQFKQIAEIIEGCLYLYIDVILLSTLTYIMLFIPPVVGCMVVLCPWILITCIINFLFFCMASIMLWCICFPYLLLYKYHILWGLYWLIIAIGITTGIVIDPLIIIPQVDNFGLDLIFMDPNNRGSWNNGPGGNGGPANGGNGGPNNGNNLLLNPFGPQSRNDSINGSPNETYAQYEKRMANRAYLGERVEELRSRGIPVYSAIETRQMEARFDHMLDHILREQLDYNLTQAWNNGRRPLHLFHINWDTIEDGKWSLKHVTYKRQVKDYLLPTGNYISRALERIYIRDTHLDNNNGLFYPRSDSSRLVVVSPEVINNVETAIKARYGNRNRGGFYAPFRP